MGAIEAGFGARDITPEDKRQTLYHREGMTPDDTVPIRDRLFARATALRDGDTVAAWASLDVCVIGGDLRRRVMAALGRRGVEPRLVALSSTHTHTAPTGHNFHGVERVPEEYVAFLVEQTADAVTDAVEDLGPATLSFGQTTVDLSVNRREIGRLMEIDDLAAPSGTVDNAVRVLRIERDNGVGLLFSYTAHPLTMIDNIPQISADFPGRAIEFLHEGGAAVHAQFLQGCAGDVNVKIRGAEAERDHAGRLMAEAVAKAADTAEPVESGELRTYSGTVHLPWARTPSREGISEMASTPPFWECGPEWSAELLRLIDEGAVPPHAELVVQALRVGDLVLLALPGEIFVKIGIQIRERAGVEKLIIVGYSNTADIGYIPTADAFPQGGYEVETAPYYYGLLQLSPECERLMVEAGARAVRSVRSASGV